MIVTTCILQTLWIVSSCGDCSKNCIVPRTQASQKESNWQQKLLGRGTEKQLLTRRYKQSPNRSRKQPARRSIPMSPKSPLFSPGLGCLRRMPKLHEQLSGLRLIFRSPKRGNLSRSLKSCSRYKVRVKATVVL